MKKLFIAICGASMILSSCSNGGSNVTLNDNQDTLSYALGALVGESIIRNIKQQFPVDTVDVAIYAKAFDISQPNDVYLNRIKAQLDTIYPDLFKAGMSDGLRNEAKFTTEEADLLLNTKAQAKRKEMQEKRKIEAEQNEAEGKSFLEDNAKKEGVVTLESGLQYKVITNGTGKKPGEKDRVKCNYRGTFIDGTEFDASKGKPASFAVGGVIKGWTEALQLMNEGSKWELYVPGNLAYGPNGNGQIGPNKTLIFEVELVEVLQPAAPKKK